MSDMNQRDEHEDELVEQLWKHIVDNGMGSFEDKFERFFMSPMGQPHLAAKEEVLRHNEQRVSRIWVGRDPAVLLAESYTQDDQWFNGVLPEAGHWASYLKTLRSAGDISEADIEALDASTNRIVACLANPHGAAAQRRGLVAGRVQSGKTSHYVGLIAKLADLGYRLFIVLSGTKTNLRGQTQRRIAEDLTSTKPADWHWLTGDEDGADINSVRNAANVVSKGGVICVVKKHEKRLETLREFLEVAGQELERCPVVIIDDEADEASIDTGDTDKSTISRLVSELLKVPIVSYVAYTGTPYANTFIDPDASGSLYPEHFLLPLPKSTSYFGAEELFGRGAINEQDVAIVGLDVIRKVTDSDDLKLRPSSYSGPGVSSFQPTACDALEEACRYFIMATAARRARNQDGHSSMLVHVHHQQKVMDRLRPVVDRVIRNLAQQWDTSQVRKFKTQWNDELEKGLAEKVGLKPVPFEDLESHITQVFRDVEVVVDHGDSDNRLNYAGDSSVVIAIGGNTLSRGLTLKGLVTSLFLRPAGQYDTLLQMGRWYGYRPGYADLQRIWTTTDLEKEIRFLALVEEEFFQEIEARAADGLTPAEVAPLIRMHQGRLQPTSNAKMGRARTVQKSFAGETVQTIRFDHRDTECISSHRTAIDELLEGHQASSINNNLVFRAIPGDSISEFLVSYRDSAPSLGRDRSLAIDYILREQEKGYLDNWNIVLVDGPQKSAVVGGHSIGMVQRSKLQKSSGPESANIGALLDPPHLICDLGVDAKKRTNNGRRDLAVRELRKDQPALLVIYIIDDQSKCKAGDDSREDLDAKAPLVGWVLKLPVDDRSKATTYVSNNAIRLRATSEQNVGDAE